MGRWAVDACTGGGGLAAAACRRILYGKCCAHNSCLPTTQAAAPNIMGLLNELFVHAPYATLAIMDVTSAAPTMMPPVATLTPRWRQKASLNGITCI